MKIVMIVLALVGAVAGVQAQAVDHRAFDTLLRNNVRNEIVNYAGFNKSADFKDYVAALARPVTFDSKAAELAYYINAYNAMAIQGILDGLSPSTLLGRTRYFKFKEWPINGRAMTLHDLEHKVIRPLGEPRIHFAIVCASRSCPVLRPEAYTAQGLDTQLEEQTRQFINDPFRNRFDAAGKVAHLSEIFKWFEEDFKGAGSTQRFIARYAADSPVARGLAADGFNVEWIEYDWKLNGTFPGK